MVQRSDKLDKLKQRVFDEIAAKDGQHLGSFKNFRKSWASSGGDKLLHLRLRVKRIEEATEEYVRVFAELQVQQTQQQQDQQKDRIVRIGLPCSDEEQVVKDMMGQVQKQLEQRGFAMLQPKPLSAEVCLFIKKQYFNALGRPTVDDYIELNARTDRSAREDEPRQVLWTDCCETEADRNCCLR